MAESFALYLKINGKAADGESTIESSAGVDRSKSIECFSFQCEAMTPRDITSGRSSVSSRQLQPIEIIKRFDRTTPLLFQALAQNQTVEGDFKFFKANLDTGAMEHFFTIAFEHGRIVSVKQMIAPTYDKANTHLAPHELVAISYGKITWTHVPGSTEFTDEFSKRM